MSAPRSYSNVRDDAEDEFEFNMPLSSIATKAPMPTTEKLYDIANARDILDAWLAESEGEMTPELEALLTELDGKADEKIERVALFVREQIALAKGIKEEEERLAARRKARERAADSLKTYLHQQMERLGKTKVDGLLCTVALQNNPPSVKGELSEVALIAIAAETSTSDTSPIVRYIPEQWQLDRKAVLARHKEGRPLPDGLTIEQSQHLRIR